MSAAPLERQIAVVTPEAAVLRLTLAGLGSRFAALLLDTVLQAMILLALALLAGLPLLVLGGLPAVTGAAVRLVWPVLAVIAVTVLVGYHLLWEGGRGGQTPGKQALGLRVVRLGGEPIGWGEAAVRNLLRPIDALPLAVPPLVAPYLLGAASVWWTARQQRLGDLVAGTMVILERPTPRIESAVMTPQPTVTETFGFTAGQLGRLTVEEIELLTRFSRRRESLPLAARRRLATDLARKLAAGIEAPEPIGETDVAERWLDSLQTAWSERRRGW